MLVPNQMIEVSWHSQSRKHYESKGYVFTKYKDKFCVPAEDLSDSSPRKVKVICDYCGKEREIQWLHYKKDVLDKGQKYACYDCRLVKKWDNNLEQRQNDYYVRALSVCNKNGYELLSAPEDIKNGNTSYIEYRCKKHGVHSMKVANLLTGRKCPDCDLELKNLRYKLSPDEVEKRIVSYGSTLLNKEDYINNSTKNLRIICNECGEVFTTSLQRFECHNGQVCRSCSQKESKGEREIRHFLEDNHIDFVQEKMFDGCKDVRMLPFDFYLPDYNLCIEFDGSQHYEDKGDFSNSLEYVQNHDRIKDQFCQSNGIELIRIPFFKFSKIETILKEKLFT